MIHSIKDRVTHAVTDMGTAEIKKHQDDKSGPVGGDGILMNYMSPAFSELIILDVSQQTERNNNK